MKVKKWGLEFKTRREIYDYILKHPGLHLSELSRKMNIPKSTINYHLKYLRKQEFIAVNSGNKYARYYVAKKVGEIDKKTLELLRQDIPYKIVLFLLSNPDSSQTKISKNLKKHPTTTSFHLDKLMSTDVIEKVPNGNEIRYRMKNPEHIFELFAKYKESFLDNTMDSLSLYLLYKI
jgi:predicted transcriptional regulator